MARLTSIKPRLATASSRIASLEDAGPRRKTQAGAEWYRTARWQKLAARVRKRDDYTCQQTGVLCLGKHPAPDSPVVDHIRPHRGDPVLFWDETNLQTVSKAWHDSEKQRREKRGLA